MNEYLQQLLSGKEDEHLEFKEARTDYSFDKLTHYMAALANELGGKLVLGVSDKKPRRVVGTQAFRDLEAIKHPLLQALHVRIEIQEIQDEGGRVLVFTAPSRPIGVPIKVGDVYWARSGGSLVSMTPEHLKEIFDEASPDFSAEVCPKAIFDDLDLKAIEEYRARWSRKAQNPVLLSSSPAQLLEDSELVTKDGITYAALILLGTHRALGQHLSQAEVVFEYRSREDAIEYQQRVDYRLGFFLFHDDLWSKVNARNERTSYREGLFKYDILAFNEGVVREAILNAICHRDYRRAGSVFVKQWPTQIEIVSPGGFPAGINQENILWKQNPRNRRIAEAVARCGMVERSGQGADLMFRSSLLEGKDPPDYSKTDAHDVCLVLSGLVRDPQFVKYLEALSAQKQVTFNTDDLVVLDAIHKERQIPDRCQDRIHRLAEIGAIEHSRRRYILARGFYQMKGEKGVYTRKRGLDRESQLALLMKHIRDNAASGSTSEEFQQVLPHLNRNGIYNLLRELKEQGMIRKQGNTRAAKWYPATSESKKEKT